MELTGKKSCNVLVQLNIKESLGLLLSSYTVGNHLYMS